MNSIPPNQRPVITSRIIDPNTPNNIPSPKIPSRGRRTLKFIALFLLVAILGIGGFIFYRAANISGKIFVGGETNLYSKISGLIQGQTGNIKLEGEKEGQINVLLLGIGGPGHDGPYLSDTIILAQIRPKDNKATLVAIPRDYLVNTKELGQRKINAVFAESYSRSKDWDDAGKSIREVVEKMSGQKIPYFAVIDFKGFEKTIDLLGGIDVTVDRTFTDYTFPNSTEGYLPAVTFTEGEEHMNGERALIFARSRHAAGPEGSDFARGIRQQKILQAAKNKLVSLNIVTDAKKINELFSVIGDHFHTNLSPGEMIHLYNLSKDFNQDQIVSLSLDPATNIVCNEVLESTGAYVLTLCPGKTADDVKDFFQNTFTAGALVSERAVVWLADSTVAGKLYKRAESELRNAGITVYKVIYTGKTLNQSVVYGVNNKPQTIEFIKANLDASPVSLPPPGIKVNKDKVDIIIILGSSNTNTTSNSSN